MTKAILISGCSTGIGYSSAKKLQQAGYRVFATARKEDDVARLQAEGLEALLLDVADSASIQQVVDSVLNETNGKLFGLINNAGYGVSGALEDLDRNALRSQFETNVFGLQELTNAVLPIMRKQGFGRIIHVSSVVGEAAIGYMGAYSASKFAVEGLADSQRIELHGSNIYLSLIQPGPIDTAFFENAEHSFNEYVGSKAKTSEHKDYYKKASQKAKGLNNKKPFSLPPSAVADQILKALDSKKPKRQYRVTMTAKIVPWLKRILPRVIFDAMMVKAMNYK